MSSFLLFPTAHWAREKGDHTAILWQKDDSPFFNHLPERLTWQDFHQQILNVACWLQQHEVNPVTLVCYCGQHRLIGLLIYCASLALGGRILMLNPALTKSQQQDILSRYQAVVFFQDSDFSAFPTDTRDCDLPPFQAHKPATFTLTSGSSGLPKAVVHSMQNHLDNALGVCELMQFSAKHCWLLSLPLFHVSGQGIVWRWLQQGACLSLCEDKERFWAALSQVSHASLVPTQLQRYLRYLKQKPNVSEQHILLGGTNIPADLLYSAEAQKLSTYSGYGMTEMASTICASQQKGIDVGKPLIGREVKIVEGEIWVRGSGLALGYWENEGLRTLTNEQGYFQTKDGGYWDQQGHLVLTGRLDNMFISGGENIQPEQIEAILFQSGWLKNVIVVPKSDPEFGERPVALVEFVQPFSEQAVRKLQDFARLQLEKFKQPVAYLPFESAKWQAGIKISRSKLKAYVADTMRG